MVKLGVILAPYWVQAGLAEGNKPLETILRPEELEGCFSKKDLGVLDVLNSFLTESLIGMYYSVRNKDKVSVNIQSGIKLSDYMGNRLDITSMALPVNPTGGVYRSSVESTEYENFNVEDPSSIVQEFLIGRVLPEGMTYKLVPTMITNSKSKSTYNYDTFLVLKVKLIKLEDVSTTRQDSKELLDFFVKHGVSLSDIAGSGLLDLL